MYYNYELDLTLNKLVQKGKNKAQSLRRTRKLVFDWLNNERLNDNFLYFITFTFEKEYNIHTFKSWNRKQFTNYLRRDPISKNFNFMLYADFGENNGRFHLHGFVSGDNSLKIGCDYFNKFGFTKVEKLKTDNSVNYVLKYSTKFNMDCQFRILKITNI